MDWSATFAARARGEDSELTAILAGVPDGVLSMTGGFPNPATFPSDELGDLAARLLRDDTAVAMQYTPCEGLPGVREYLRDRQEQTQGARPAEDELIVTSGGMECIRLLCSVLLDAGDTVAVEAPTYLGALVAFRGAQAAVEPIAMDDDGLVIEALAERLEGGLDPAFLYVIPDFQNPTGRTLSVGRRHALVELCRRHRVLIVEDVAYRELPFDDGSPPSLWSLAPDVVLQAGTFSKTFFPGVRLGWACGPADVIGALAAAKQTTDQCAGALGQRLLEEYGRGGGFERALPAARALYAGHWAALDAGLREHLPAGCTWTQPRGGFLTWVTLPDDVDALALRGHALDAGVAFVPGMPFHVDGGGRSELRLSFSALGPADLREGARRLGAALAAMSH